MLHVYRRASLREEFERSLRSGAIRPGSLTRIETALPGHTLRWEKQGRECWWNGELYDVVSIDTIGDKLVITALNDDTEKNLLETYAQMAEQEHSGQKENSARFLIHFFETDAIVYLPIIQIPHKEPRFRFTLQSGRLLQTPHLVITPPPRQFV